MSVHFWFLMCFFFFKQKTAYEMRISDWSSDVCSSDLGGRQDEVGDRQQGVVLLRLEQLQRNGGERVGREEQEEEHAGESQRNGNRQSQHQQQEHQHERSEEHTSELQSLMRISYAVFRFKKKNNNSRTILTTITATTS